MKKNTFLFILCCFLLSPTLSYALAREDTMNETLAKMEGSSAVTEKKPEQTWKTEPAQENKTPYYKSKSEKNIFYISAGYNVNRVRYKELSGGNVLDEEHGVLQGFNLYATYKDHHYIEALLGKPFVEAYYRNYGDSLKYEGRASSGATTYDFSFKPTHADIHQFGLKLGAYTDFSKKGELSVYFDVGRRIWQRGQNTVIKGVLVYAEKYYWTYFGLGMGINYLRIPNLIAGVDVEGMFAPDSFSHMRSDLYEGGTFNIKHVSGVEVRLPLKYFFLKNISFDLTPYFTYWQIGKSNLVLINGTYYYEPDSKTKILGLVTGLSYYF